MKILDLFSGIGGFSLGLERAGFETVAFCEIDKKAQLVLKKHWPQVPIYDDVSAITGETFRDQTIDIICGGFPCQDISLAGKGAGLAGERSGLWFQFHRLIKEIRPLYAIIENVAALRSRGLDEVLRSLFEIGYDAEWHCIPASAVGAPHRRDRVWIVAYPSCERYEQWGKQRDLYQEKWRPDGQVRSEFSLTSEESKNVAYPKSDGWEQRFSNVGRRTKGIESREKFRFGDGGETMAYPDNNGRDGSENTNSDTERNGGGAPRKDISEQSSGSSDLGRDVRGSEEKIMAYPTGTGLSQRGQSRQHSSAAQERTGLVDEFERCGETMADSNSPRLEGQREIAGRIGAELNNARNAGWWAVEPDVGRVAHGIPKRVDRLKQLGNSVVPQIPELIGRAIKAHHGIKGVFE